MSRVLLSAGLAALLLASATQAQTVAPASPPDATAPKPQNEVPQAKEPGAASGTLSEQLSHSGGVIHPPPQVDRNIKAPTPDPGPQSMPVIPPPGTPGGDPTVKPK